MVRVLDTNKYKVSVSQSLLDGKPLVFRDQFLRWLVILHTGMILTFRHFLRDNRLQGQERSL